MSREVASACVDSLEPLLLRGGVRKFVLKNAPKDAQFVPPFSKVRLAYKAFVVRSQQNRGEESLGSSSDDINSPGAYQHPDPLGGVSFRNTLVQEDNNFEVCLGSNLLHQCVENAILTMRCGETAKLEVPPDRAFGECDVPELKVSRHDSLLFEIHVKNFFPEIDLSPSKNRSLTKYIVLSGTTDGRKPQYESTVTILTSRVDDIMGRLHHQRQNIFTIGGEQMSVEWDLTVLSMLPGELANVTIFGVTYVVTLKVFVGPPIDPAAVRGTPRGIEEASKRRTEGNNLHGKQLFVKAKEKYLYAISFLIDPSTDIQIEKLSDMERDIIATCYGNAAQCMLSHGDNEESRKLATKAIEISSQTAPKYFFRRAKANRLLHRLDEAERDLMVTAGLMGGIEKAQNDPLIAQEFRDLESAKAPQSAV